jgi:predicted nicotinamide N-methyase
MLVSLIKMTYNRRELDCGVIIESSGELGIGGTIWDAGLVLASFLEKNSTSIFTKPGTRILELGSGTGVLGLCAAKIAPDFVSEVVITDIGNHLDLIAHNLSINPDLASRVTISKLDWFAPENLGEFDVVIGSDISYFSELYVPLMTTLEMHYRPETLVLFSREIRKEEDAEYYSVS